MKKILFLVLLAALFFLSGKAPASEIICRDVADIYIDEWFPDQNFNYKTRVLVATNMNIHHGIARGLFRFDIPGDVDASEIKTAAIYLSACSHCGGGNGGLVGFYALNVLFDEETDTWNTLTGGDWDSSVYSEAVLPGGNGWNQAVDGEPPDGVEGLDITTLLKENLEKARANGIMMRFQDEHQEPCTHQNVASRESEDPFDFPPYLVITKDEPLFQFVQVSDTHIGKTPPQQADNLDHAVDQINEINPAFVLFTGDLTDYGKLEEYAAFKDALSNLAMPYYCVPGDNDIIDGEGDIERYREQLGDDYYAFDYQGLNFIGLNNNFYLSLDEDQRQWLADELNEGKTEIIFAHRPLLNHENGEPISGAETLLSLFESYHVAMYMNGDEHLSAEHTRNGAHHIWCDNLSWFHSGEETYNLYQVYSDHILLYHVYFDGSQVPAGSFPLIIETPDLVVSEKMEECIDLDEGTYLVHYRVQNIGNGAAGETVACLYIDGVHIEEADQTVGPLGAGEESDILTFAYTAAFTPPDDTVRVCIDCRDDIVENDETNNCMENVWSGHTILFDIQNGAGAPGSTCRKVELDITNAVAVSGIQVDIYDEDDWLTLSDVELTDRASGFACDFEDDYGGTGCARVILYSAGGSFIPPGNDSVLTLHYDVKEGAPSCECRAITSENLLITDENNDPLSAAEDPGGFFFGIFGDVWPYNAGSGTVGDGLVNIFDVVRDIQILLEAYTPAYCELAAGDVPTGEPPYCLAPDGVINVQDILIIVARILGRQNCIESYCNPYSDEEQVQVVTGIDEFVPFPSPPPEIIYGPYSLKVTPETAIIAWEERGWNDELRHVEVNVAGFSPLTRYLYRVNGAEKDGRFLTPPLDNSPFSFFVWGDSRTGTDIAGQIADKMIETDPDASFALHTGDFVIDGDRLECWDSEWWGPMSDLMLYLPIYPTMGNHEAGSPFYYRYFSALGGNGSNYSFDWDGSHFLVFDSTAENFGSDEQIEWITSDLQQNQDANFTVVSHHLPVYASSTAGGSGSEDLQDILVPIYEQYGVDLVFNGDVHTYQHHLKENIHYLIAAGGGANLYDYGLPLEGMTLKLFKTYNFCHLQVEGQSIQIITYDLEGNILDNFELTSGGPTDINSRIVVEASSSEVMPGEQFRLDLFVRDAEDLDKVSFTLAYYKDDPPIMLEVIDANPAIEGVQIEAGELGGDVVTNLADNDQGNIEYREENTGGLSSEIVKVASATFKVPGNAMVTAVYLIPKFSLFDTSGEEIPHFMGGVKVAIISQ